VKIYFARHRQDTNRTQNRAHFWTSNGYNPACVLGSPGVELMSCKVNFHVVWSALQNLMCPLGIFGLINSSLDPTFCSIFVCSLLQLMFSKLDRSGQPVETNTMSTLRITMGGNNFLLSFILDPHVISYPLPPRQRNNFQNITAIGVGRRLEIKLNG